MPSSVGSGTLQFYFRCRRKEPFNATERDLDWVRNPMPEGATTMSIPQPPERPYPPVEPSRVPPVHPDPTHEPPTEPEPCRCHRTPGPCRRIPPLPSRRANRIRPFPTHPSGRGNREQTRSRALRVACEVPSVAVGKGRRGPSSRAGSPGSCCPTGRGTRSRADPTAGRWVPGGSPPRWHGPAQRVRRGRWC